MNCDLIQNEPAPTSGASLASTLLTPGRYRLAAIFQRPHIYFCQFMQNVAAHPEIDLTVYFYTRLGMGSTPDPHFGRPLYAASTLLTGYRARFLEELLSLAWGGSLFCVVSSRSGSRAIPRL